MKPPYFGFFELSLDSKAKTFDECLQEADGDMDQFEPIEDFFWFFGNEDCEDDFLDGVLFKFFCPEGETHDIYVYCGEDRVSVTLKNGKEYVVDTEWTMHLRPKDPDDDSLEFREFIEEEYEHLSSQYSEGFKKVTFDEFQEMFDNMNYPTGIHMTNLKLPWHV